MGTQPPSPGEQTVHHPPNPLFPQQGAHGKQDHSHSAIRKDPVRPSHELDAQVWGQDSRAAPAASRCGANAPKSQQSSGCQAG